MGLFSKYRNTLSPNTPTHASRWRRVQRTLLIVTLATTVFYTGATLAAGLWVKHDLATLETEIRAKGEPLTPAELNAYYPRVPDAENGATAYLKAAEVSATFYDKSGIDSERYGLEGALNEPDLTYETLARLSAYIEVRAPVFTALDDALVFKSAEYHLDLSELNWTNRHALNSVGRFKSLLWLRGLNAMHTQDWDTIAQTEQNLLHLAQTLAPMPDETAQLEYTSFIRTANALLFRVIRSQNAPASLYTSLDPLLQEVDLSRSLRMLTLALRVEYAAKMDAFYGNDTTVFRESELDTLRKYRYLLSIPGVRTWGTWEKWRGMRFCTEILDDHEKPWPVRFANTLEREPYTLQLHRRLGPELGEPPPGTKPLNFLEDFLYWLNPYDIAWYEPMDWTDHYVGAESRLRFLRIAMRVDAFRAEHGAFPKSIDELTWRIPESIATDPYRGESIRYRAVDNGFRLYSVGENLKDDGGLYNLDGVVELIRETPPAPTKAVPTGPS